MSVDPAESGDGAETTSEKEGKNESVVSASLAGPASSADPHGAKSDPIQILESVVKNAIAADAKQEIIIIVFLGLFFLVGIGLVLFGAYRDNVSSMISGGVVGAVMMWPIHRLISLRNQKLALRTIPGLLRIASQNKRNELTYLLAQKLINRV